MLHFIKRVTGLDACANGGSLNVSFEGYFGKKFCLLFPANPPQPSLIGKANATFLPPVLDAYSQVKQKLPTTGEVSIDWSKESKAISWRDARKLLRQLKRHVTALGPDDQGIYEAMLRASRNEGRA
jgi:hypothetical protein